MIFASEVLRSFLQRKQIATLEELKQDLGTTSTMTVFRKLKSLGYRTSYSHRGKYYTLEEIPRFDEQGLWSYRDAWFSREGTLLATAQRFVEQAPAGLTAGELQAVLGVEVQTALAPAVSRQAGRAEDGGRDIRILCPRDRAATRAAVTAGSPASSLRDRGANGGNPTIAGTKSRDDSVLQLAG
jgi:hypothetical protein